MERVLIFDVDGTITGPRRIIHEDFARFFRSIVQVHTVFLVSGSDLPKLKEQLPDWLIEAVGGTFTCSGNELFVAGQAMFRMDHAFPDEIIEFAQNMIDASAYPTRAGLHIEPRTGTLNVSVVGRNANPLQRRDYETWDAKHRERAAMCEAINDAFPDYEANRGGKISIDVSPRGWNKSRVYTELSSRYRDAEFHFFGDNVKDGGNDMPLATAVREGGEQNQVHAVRDHFETWKILQEHFAPGRSSQQVA